jgi:Ca2+-binding EF-hand superfamily protein
VTAQFEGFCKILEECKAKGGGDLDALIADIWPVFDKEGVGSIKRAELTQILTKLGMPADTDEIKEAIAKADKDGDHLISKEEFKKLLE